MKYVDIRGHNRQLLQTASRPDDMKNKSGRHYMANQTFSLCEIIAVAHV